ncbi:MAG: AGE family epimerase/isomerase [Francisellaceae bacterium]
MSSIKMKEKAFELLQSYYSALKQDIDKNGYTAEFLGLDEPGFQKTRLLCQSRSLFFMLCYFELSGDDQALIYADKLYTLINTKFHDDTTGNWKKYPDDDRLDDLYEYAFLLFSFSKYYRQRSNTSVLNNIKQLHQIMIDEVLKDFSCKNLTQSDGRISQNALMHLFEAYLEAYKATSEDDFKHVLERLLETIADLFYCKNIDLIAEYAPINSEDCGENIYEPGHSFEWCCLLYEAENFGIELAKLKAFDAIAKAAETHGVIDNKVVAPAIGGGQTHTPQSLQFRIWPVLERLRYYAMSENQATLKPAFESFCQLFIDKNQLPIEYIDHRLAPGFNKIKSTTSYHLINALQYVIRGVDG